MSTVHPLFIDHAWLAGTGPLKGCNAAVTRCLRVGLPSLVIEGEAGVGKTAAALDVLTGLAADKRAIPWRASAVGVKREKDLGLFYRSFQCMAPLSTSRRTTLRIAVDSEQERALNSVTLSADKAQRVVLLIDHAENLSHLLLTRLRDALERFSELHIHLFVLLLAQPGFVDKLMKFIDKPDGMSLVQRFGSFLHPLRGLTAADLETLMEHPDHDTFPAGGPTYTEHFVPKLFRDGWRLRDQAPYLWSAFEQEATGMRLDVSNLRVSARAAVWALRCIMSELERENGRASDMRSLAAHAVEVSGFRAAHEFKAKADAARKESRSGRFKNP